MPKLKTHKGAAKRFSFTKSGKVKKNSAFKRHILTKKSTKRKRQLRKQAYLNPVDVPAIRKMLPYA